MCFVLINYFRKVPACQLMHRGNWLAPEGQPGLSDRQRNRIHTLAVGIVLQGRGERPPSKLRGPRFNRGSPGGINTCRHPCRRRHGRCFFFSGLSVIMASVVSISPATEAAFCRANRTTLVGSITPAANKVFISLGGGIVAVVVFAFQDLVQHHRTFLSGIVGDLPQGFLQGAFQDLNAVFLFALGNLPCPGHRGSAPGPLRRPARCLLPRRPGWR